MQSTNFLLYNICYENIYIEKTKLERLDLRRIKLSLSFAKKSVKHPLHSSWFKKQPENEHINTRSAKPKFAPVQARTQRLKRSPISYLTQLLNDDAHNS